jgi:hypothetical protein
MMTADNVALRVPVRGRGEITVKPSVRGLALFCSATGGIDADGIDAIREPHRITADLIPLFLCCLAAIDHDNVSAEDIGAALTPEAMLGMAQRFFATARPA